MTTTGANDMTTTQTPDTFAADLQSMMTRWDAMMAEARLQFPDATDEELFHAAGAAQVKHLRAALGA